MKLVTLLFILNATILLLHEIESSYEREWEMLHLPGKIEGFLLLHIPIILLFFFGVLEINRLTYIGLLIGIITGIGGVIPLLIHKIFFIRKDKFHSPISNALIYMSTITGVVTIGLSVKYMISGF